MPNSVRSAEDVQHLAQEIYTQKLCAEVETSANKGKIILIDTDSGDYAIADNSVLANKRLREKHPCADPYALFAIRIGHDAVYSLNDVLAGLKA